jgi:hypothetical protein
VGATALHFCFIYFLTLCALLIYFLIPVKHISAMALENQLKGGHAERDQESPWTKSCLWVGTGKEK